MIITLYGVVWRKGGISGTARRSCGRERFGPQFHQHNRLDLDRKVELRASHGASFLFIRC